MNTINTKKVRPILIDSDEFSGDNHNTPTIFKPKLTNGFVNIVYSTIIDNNKTATITLEQTTNIVKSNQYSHNLLCNMQYYYEYCLLNSYVTPQEWLEKYKHYIDKKEQITYTEKEVILLCQKAFEDSCKYSSFKDFIEENFNNNKNK